MILANGQFRFVFSPNVLRLQLRSTAMDWNSRLTTSGIMAGATGGSCFLPLQA